MTLSVSCFHDNLAGGRSVKYLKEKCKFKKKLQVVLVAILFSVSSILTLATCNPDSCNFGVLNHLEKYFYILTGMFGLYF